MSDDNACPLVEDAIKNDQFGPPAATNDIRRNILFDDQLIKQDIDASKAVISEIIDRVKNPPKDERYVGFDSLPSPLQRVIKAYMTVATAQEELDLAVKALRT
jgi:hypothetical protein